MTSKVSIKFLEQYQKDNLLEQLIGEMGYEVIETKEFFKGLFGSGTEAVHEVKSYSLRRKTNDN